MCADISEGNGPKVIIESVQRLITIWIIRNWGAHWGHRKQFASSCKYIEMEPLDINQTSVYPFIVLFHITFEFLITIIYAIIITICVITMFWIYCSLCWHLYTSLVLLNPIRLGLLGPLRKTEGELAVPNSPQLQIITLFYCKTTITCKYKCAIFTRHSHCQASVLKQTKKSVK